MPEHQTERKMREEPQGAVRFFTIWGGVKYRMLHIPGILDCTYHLHVSCLCAQGSSIAEYLDYSP